MGKRWSSGSGECREYGNKQIVFNFGEWINFCSLLSFKNLQDNYSTIELLD